MRTPETLQYNIDNRYPRPETASMTPIRSSTLLAMVVALSALPVRAHAQDHSAEAHEHGVGQLEIALDGGRLEIGFTTPGSDVVGFEGQPADEADVAKVKSALATLDDPKQLFGFEPAGACSASGGARIEPPAAALQPVAAAGKAVAASADAHDHHAEHDHDHDHDHAEASSGHGNWRASYTFECSSPTAIVVNLFDVFPSLQTIRTQLIAPGAQTGAELTPGSRRIDFGPAR